MIDHDKNVGAVLKALDDLGIAGRKTINYGSIEKRPERTSWHAVRVCFWQIVLQKGVEGRRRT
jgi:hypothetical protein